MMRSSLSYTLARILMFVVCLLAFWALGIDLLISAFLAATLSMVLSLFLLRRLRERFSDDVADAVSSRTQRKAARRRGRGPGDETIEDAEAAQGADDQEFVGDERP